MPFRLNPLLAAAVLAAVSVALSGCPPPPPCLPESNSAFCAAQGRACGPATGTDTCGTARTVANCGTCSGTGRTCGGGGTPGLCGCTPESNSAFCAAQGLACGPATGTDHCGFS